MFNNKLISTPPKKISLFYNSKTRERDAVYNAIERSQAVIEFTMDGTIINANKNFLDAMGYTLDEVIGRHHSIFVDPHYAQSREYESFWENLRRGEYATAEYQRFGKGGKEVWIQASYNPILDLSGKPFKVVKFATDITKEKMRNADFSGQIAAIGKSQAVIEFAMDGTILNANKNFLDAMGYTLDEIKGKHHRIFVDQKYAQSCEYEDFWEKLRRGEYATAEYQRFGKGGKEVWIQASYNPILDLSGRPFKVVKFATDVTRSVMARKKSEELVKDMYSNVQAVAAAAEEMTSSISEISKNMSDSNTAVDNIASQVTAADTLMNSLQDTSKSMESVVDLIRDIAEQVNLLALNATIEAARAGDAGRGFAVVASEVKNLAGQVGKATDDILGKITSLQGMTAQAAQSSKSINDATQATRTAVSAVASAIEEQTAVTQEISSKMQMVSKGIGDVKDCINEISSKS